MSFVLCIHKFYNDNKFADYFNGINDWFMCERWLYDNKLIIVMKDTQNKKNWKHDVWEMSNDNK